MSSATSYIEFSNSLLDVIFARVIVIIVTILLHYWLYNLNSPSIYHTNRGLSIIVIE